MTYLNADNHWLTEGAAPNGPLAPHVDRCPRCGTLINLDIVTHCSDRCYILDTLREHQELLRTLKMSVTDPDKNAELVKHAARFGDCFEMVKATLEALDE